MELNNPLELISVQVFGIGAKVFFADFLEEGGSYRGVKIEISYVIGTWEKIWKL